MEKSNIIKKSNNLVLSKCNLSAIQQKILCIALSKIYKDDEELKPFSMPATDFLTLLKMEENYTYIKKILKDFGNKPIEFYKDSKNWAIYSWFTSAECKNGIIKIKFNPDLSPFLLNLKKNFTQYSLDNILNLDSKYNIKLYEFFKSALGDKKTYILTVNVDEFKKLLNIEKMPFFKVKQSILDNINLSGTDINIKYKLIKKNKKVIKLSFKINKIEKLKILTNNKIIFDYEKKWFAGLKESHLEYYLELFNNEMTRQEILNELEKMANWIAKKTEKLKNKDWTEEIEKWLERKYDGSHWSDYYDNF
ncbi:MAG: replication initiation protein [bacterium]